MIVSRLNWAILNKDSQAYATSLDAFNKQQAACLAFLKKKQPKIGSEQLIKIRNANTRRRRAEYNARIKKEREEQLEEKRLKNKDSQEVVITANSIEELKKKIDDYNYLQMADTVKTDAEKYLGRTIDFKG